MQSAGNLRVYHAAEELAVLVYTIVRELPMEERFALGQQMRRSVVSIGSNIAEGCGRGGNAELARFLAIALGSASELEFQLRIVIRLTLVAEGRVDPVVRACVGLERMLTRLIVRIRPSPRVPRPAGDR